MVVKVRKAVFPVAGLGTRFLPVTKAMPKELLPIIDKPLIQYAAEEAIAAGIDTLIFVTGRNKRAIEDHFDNNQELNMALLAKGKTKEAAMIKNILPSGIECIFVRQPEQLGLGHAVLCAERVVGKDPFAVILADDFLTYKDNAPMAELVQHFENTGKNQLSIVEVNGPDITKYGVIIPGAEPGAVIGLVEKPKIENSPSNLASIGRYVLTSDIFDVLRNLSVCADNEIQLSAAINILAEKNKVEAVMLDGVRFDCGSKKDYVAAIKYVASNYKFD
ncbi:UTP--glucose-1-phosphate uridylyltransferase [Amylibacter sp.]|jgi:UTP--glucose-1-phosphate uridylyltransferase|nr:UTP--glucose-1-phosphate uridylyltransferase [Amylibacter sp.]